MIEDHMKYEQSKSRSLLVRLDDAKTMFDESRAISTRVKDDGKNAKITWWLSTGVHEQNTTVGPFLRREKTSWLHTSRSGRH